MTSHWFPNPNYRPRRQTLQLFGVMALTSLTTIAVVMAFTRDPYAKYRDAQFVRGMWIDDIKAQFGEPDCFQDYWGQKPDDRIGGPKNRDVLHPYHIEYLMYGVFGAYDHDGDLCVKHRLHLWFTNGKLERWHKSSPAGER